MHINSDENIKLPGKELEQVRKSVMPKDSQGKWRPKRTQEKTKAIKSKTLGV